MLNRNAVGYGRLRHGAATWQTRRSIGVVFDTDTLAPLCENMPSSTRPELPEVPSILYCRHRRTESRPQVACTENLVKFGVCFLNYATGQTHRQSNVQTRL